MTNAPMAAAFTSAPLRNRIRVELKSEISDVWALLGDLARFPEYCSGLASVDATEDANGRCIEYVCHFKALEDDGEGLSHRDLVRWYEPNRGYASSGEPGNALGFTNDLNLVALEPSTDGTILTWDEYYDAYPLDIHKASLDRALADIAENLIRRFGGKVIERYVQPTYAHGEGADIGARNGRHAFSNTSMV